MDEAQAKKIILDSFPSLDKDKLEITSPRTRNYNCIAYAADDNTKWWWPTGRSYWPKGVNRVEKLPAFQMAFETLQYEGCSNGDLEDGYEKIAIFHKDSKPTHAAKQLRNGLWSSKLGIFFDISHDIEGMQGKEYGNIAFYMKRKIN